MVPTAFLFRIADDDGNTMTDLLWSKDASKSSLPSGSTAPEPVMVQVPPGTAAGTSTITLYSLPEHPIAFPTQTTDFSLQSWSSSSLAFYSGSVTYEKEFVLGEGDINKELAIDLGEVGVAAEVWLNDVDTLIERTRATVRR